MISWAEHFLGLNWQKLFITTWLEDANLPIQENQDFNHRATRPRYSPLKLNQIVQ